MAKAKHPVTAAVRALRAAQVDFEPHEYAYVDKGGTAASAQALGVPEHHVIKTLIMEDEARNALVVLMHGDRSVSTKQLARHLGRKTIRPCEPATAERHSGYKVGGTSPFGTRRPMPTFVERSITELDRIYLNGGQRGFLISITPTALIDVLTPQLVEVAV
ncbi:MAG: Cys-tRNA(Pro) deacylase [Myxococcales bacterium FL481]|nr:MAG: Cys-tRNA(Pro) deacylase [Myxococcales bacterium FL481]